MRTREPTSESLPPRKFKPLRSESRQGTDLPHPYAAKIREALIFARTERQQWETMEEALVRELAARGLAIVEITSPGPGDRG